MMQYVHYVKFNAVINCEVGIFGRLLEFWLSYLFGVKVSKLLSL